MIRLLQAVCLAGAAVALAACSESNPTAPGAAPAVSAARDVGGFAAPASASCTVTQLAQFQYQAIVTWSGIKATGIEFFQGSTVVGQTVFGHPLRKGTVTDTLPVLPDYVEVIGAPLGAKTPCSQVI